MFYFPDFSCGGCLSWKCMKYVKMQVLFNFYELKLVMPRLIYGIKLLVGGVVA